MVCYVCYERNKGIIESTKINLKMNMKYNEKTYKIGDNVEFERGGIKVKAVVEEKRNSFGHEEYKLQPLSEHVSINKWIRSLKD